MILMPGDIVMFKDGARTVIGYIRSLDDLGNGHVAANCIGLIVDPNQPLPPRAWSYRVPAGDLTWLDKGPT